MIELVYINEDIKDIEFLNKILDILKQTYNTRNTKLYILLQIKKYLN